MADITVRRNHEVEKDVLRARLDDLVADLKAKYGLTANWDGNTCTLTGSGLKKAVLVMSESEVALDITLGMMGKMFKPQVEKEVAKKVEKILDS
jgi:putative polyhydroxyalkanoate system protein